MKEEVEEYVCNKISTRIMWNVWKSVKQAAIDQNTPHN